MIRPELTKLLQELPNSPYGNALKAYLEEELSKIDTVDGVGSYDEAIGRQKAVVLIKKVFSFYGDLGQQGDKRRTTYT